MKRQPLAIFSLAALALCVAVLPLAIAAKTAAKNPPVPAAPQDVAVHPQMNDGTGPALAAIAGHGMMDSHAYEYLEQLSDDVGPRLTGSERCNQAVQWGVATMKKIGLQNVRAEPWQIFRGWQRVSASAEVVSPSQHPLMVDSMGWVGSTPRGGVTADLIPFNVFDLDNELAHNSSNWRGKILIAIQKGPRPEGDGMVEFAKFGDVLKKAHEVGAVAVIGGQAGAKSQGMHLTHTGALGFATFYDIPVVSISAEDQDLLERFLDRGKQVRVHIDVQNRVTDGPADTANVVGEIPGTEHPEQIIVVGGHLDSWDLSEGATDDGVGVVTTLGAAEAIIRSGFKPRRTIRFVLFTGEEEGLLGSLAYTKTHKSEMKNHVAAVILDNGQGPVTALNMGGRDDTVSAASELAANLSAFGKITANDNTEFGTDVGPFILEGLPGINLDQDSPEYRYTHHSNVDTFDKVDEAILARDATVQGLVAFWIADRPERLASPWPPDRTAQMLIEHHDDVMLKLFGLWPFGNQ
ncbi:MAG TPA: M20/M25/M40 family metallo-hydrolase [Candidatus Acidoferrales bacterium]|nr:M20/M25/M40 family metallo-hydrolase [Candidatus Acidoferrales bacterium]